MRTKLKNMLVILRDYTNVIKSFKMTLNSKHRIELKTKSQRKMQKREKPKTQKTKT